MHHFRIFTYAALSSIVDVIILILSSYIAIVYFGKAFSLTARYYLLISGIFGVIFGLTILFGYLQIAKIHKIKELATFTKIYILIGFIVPLELVLELFGNTTIALITSIAGALLSGVIYIIFGFKLIKAKPQVPKYFKRIGIFYIVMGVSSCSIIFLILVPLIGIILRILETSMFVDINKI